MATRSEASIVPTRFTLTASLRFLPDIATAATETAGAAEVGGGREPAGDAGALSPCDGKEGVEEADEGVGVSKAFLRSIIRCTAAAGFDVEKSCLSAMLWPCTGL
jgi:hypothetical protein